MNADEKALYTKLAAALDRVSKMQKPKRRVQIAQLNLMDSGVSVAGLWISSYDINEESSQVKECWLVGEEFVFVGTSGVQGVCSMGSVKCWTALPHKVAGKEHAIDWLSPAAEMTPEDRDTYFKMQK